MGDFPLMTDAGTFIINGAERVIVSQLHRSPGVFFDEVIHPNGKKLFSARVIPYRGSWVEFGMDVNDVLYVYLDSKKKLPLTTLFRCVGYSSDEELVHLFYEDHNKKVNLGGKKSSEYEGSYLAETVVTKERKNVQNLIERSKTYHSIALAAIFILSVLTTLFLIINVNRSGNYQRCSCFIN